MSSVNKVILIGNLGRDPEVRATQSGQRVVTLSVATSEKWKDKNSGEAREKTEWHRVVIFNEPLGEVAERYLRKGSKIYIEGALQTRKWADQSGQDRYSTEVVLAAYRGQLVMLGDRGGDHDAADDAPRQQPAATGGGNRGTGAGLPSMADLDDDIPF